MSFGTPEEEDEDEDLFDFLTVGTGLGRMSNQDVELPRIRVPKADTSASGSLSAPVSAIAKSPGELLPAPRIVESVSDPEWMNRLQEESRPYYALSNASSLGIGESSRSAASMRSIRRNSFSSIMSSSSRTPLAPSAAPPATVSGGSGFKKLAASIKSSTMSRRSMKVKPPPLRTSGVLDVSSLTYVTEFQENIRSIQVLISGVDTTFLNTADLQLEVTGPTEAVLISKSDATPRFVISLPSPAHLGQTVNLQAIDDYLEARLSANSAKSKFGPLLHSSITHALSAPSLRVLAPRSICCTSCDRVVAHLPLDVEFKDLPSEYWAEMIEVWMCHADPSFTSQLAKHTSDGFWPTMETVLVGGSYLLVSGSHICDSNLILEKSNEVRLSFSIPYLFHGLQEGRRHASHWRLVPPSRAAAVKLLQVSRSMRRGPRGRALMVDTKVQQQTRRMSRGARIQFLALRDLRGGAYLQSNITPKRRSR
jgi:hypothetical protein